MRPEHPGSQGRAHHGSLHSRALKNRFGGTTWCTASCTGAARSARCKIGQRCTVVVKCSLGQWPPQEAKPHSETRGDTSHERAHTCTPPHTHTQTYAHIDAQSTAEQIVKNRVTHSTTSHVSTQNLKLNTHVFMTSTHPVLNARLGHKLPNDSHS